MLSRTALCIQHQALTRTNAVSHRIAARSMHLTCGARSAALASRNVLNISRYTPALAAYSKRYASTTETAHATTNEFLRVIETPGRAATSSAADAASQNVAESVVTSKLDAIPDIPLPPAQTALDTVSNLNHLGEPTFQSLGLGSWWPSGIVQSTLEFFHVGLGLPWWECIVVGTVIIRIALFPLVVLSQRNAARMANNMPELQRIQADMTEARITGDHFMAAKYGQEMMLFWKRKDMNPWKNMIVPMAQVPIFLSCFIGLRKMTELPVESMKEGGLWWFKDLTIADPYYILPLITATTLAVTIEVGTDSTRAQSMGQMRWLLRAMPVVVLPFTLHFPGAILCYWVSSNFISLIQVGILRVPKIRTFFKIDPIINHPPKALPNQKGFVEGFKTSWSNMKASREMSARFQADEIQFNQAGRGPLRKTYAYDPTKQTRPTAGAVLAKKRQ